MQFDHLEPSQPVRGWVIQDTLIGLETNGPAAHAMDELLLLIHLAETTWKIRVSSQAAQEEETKEAKRGRTKIAASRTTRSSRFFGLPFMRN